MNILFWWTFAVLSLTTVRSLHLAHSLYSVPTSSFEHPLVASWRIITLCASHYPTRITQDRICKIFSYHMYSTSRLQYSSLHPLQIRRIVRFRPQAPSSNCTHHHLRFNNGGGSTYNRPSPCIHDGLNIGLFLLRCLLYHL